MDQPHCGKCGKENPETSDGYTICCNNTVCCGDKRNKFGLSYDYVVACCWAKADKIFKSQGRKTPKGSHKVN